jgi:cyclophilin family peptidyl-prolyl cis-trans isomerase
MIRNTRPQPRRVRRASRTDEGSRIDPYKVQLPGPLAILTNPKVFITIGIAMAAAIIFSLFPVFTSQPTTGDSPISQMNELPDVPRDQADGSTAPAAATPTNIKRYSQAPAMAIDTSKRYVATISTAKGDIQVELYPDQAPEAVNAFVFLAKDGFYDGTPFMELVKNPDGSKFYTQAGDPTRTGLGSPGFSVRKEQTTRPFARGAVGMGGSSANSNGGQFFISFGNYPALDGKYTIFGQVVSGLDILDRITLLDLTNDGSPGPSDLIQSVSISESDS